MKLGFICMFTNNCIYIKWEKRRIVLLVLVYIDNMVINSSSSQFITLFKTVLSNNFEVTGLGELKFMLGI